MKPKSATLHLLKTLTTCTALAVMLTLCCCSPAKSSVESFASEQSTASREQKQTPPAANKRDSATNQSNAAPAKEDDFVAFTKNTPIKDVITDPAFEGFGELLFPVDEGYMRGNTLGDISLSWYSAIDPQETVDELNYLKSEALSGKQVFYPIYSEAEMKADPWKRDTGLFFFRGEKGARTAICNAGGGFAYVAALHDSFPHAFELSKMGYNAFALIYRPGAQTACEDLSRAIAFLFDHADELGIDMDGYSLWGGSAGARMAAWVGTMGTQAFGEQAYPQPAAVIMEYTGLSDVMGNEPPTFSVVGTSDGIANWRVMEARTNAIRRNGTPAEIKVYDGLSHGFGLGTGTVAEGWINDAVKFWQEAIEFEEAGEK